MMKKTKKRGLAFIALVVSVAALASAPVAGADIGFLQPDASWAEGA